MSFEPAYFAGRPGLYDDGADPAVWSNTAHGGARLTWREKCQWLEERLSRAEAMVAVISDLDRCVHGRHEQDACGTCQSIGHDLNGGNPFLRPGKRIGTDLSGRPIVYPGGGCTDPEQWLGGAS